MTEYTVDPVTVWLALAIIALGTYTFRLSFFELFRQVDEVPPRVEKALTFVPLAVIAAILVPELVLVDGKLLLGAGNEKLLAGGFAAVAAWRTENIVVTIGVGMTVLWLLTLSG